MVLDTGLAGRCTTGIHVQAESEDLRGESIETRGGEVQPVLANLRQCTRASNRLRRLSLAEAEDAARTGKLLLVGDGLFRRQVRQRCLRSDER